MQLCWPFFQFARVVIEDSDDDEEEVHQDADVSEDEPADQESDFICSLRACFPHRRLRCRAAAAGLRYG